MTLPCVARRILTADGGKTDKTHTLGGDVKSLIHTPQQLPIAPECQLNITSKAKRSYAKLMHPSIMSVF